MSQKLPEKNNSESRKLLIWFIVFECLVPLIVKKGITTELCDITKLIILQPESRKGLQTKYVFLGPSLSNLLPPSRLDLLIFTLNNYIKS